MDYFGLENPKLQGWVILPLIAGVRHTRVALLVTCTAKDCIDNRCISFVCQS